MTTPPGDYDLGHVFVLEQHFNGIPTDRFSVISTRGLAIEDVVINLARFEVVAGTTKPLISRDAAQASLVAKLRSEGVDPHAPGSPSLDLVLRYVWSPQHNASLKFQATFLSPQWASVHNGQVMVDAWTGKVWIND